MICAAPAGEGAWWRAQVITFYKDSGEVEIRYVDYGGYDRVKIDSLRQIRWVGLPCVAVPTSQPEQLLFCLAGPTSSRCRFKVPKFCWTASHRFQVGLLASALASCSALTLCCGLFQERTASRLRPRRRWRR